MDVFNKEHKHGLVRIDASASESTFPFSLAYIATSETVTQDTVYLPLHTLSVAVDETNADYRPLIRTASYTLKELNATNMYFKSLHTKFQAVPLRKALMILDKYASYTEGSRSGHYARQLAKRLRASSFLKSIQTHIDANTAGKANMVLGCISDNLFYRGRSFKPVTTPGWDKPFKVSEKYKNNPIKPKPYVESCAPLPPVITEPKAKKTTSKRKAAAKSTQQQQQRPFDNIILSGSSDKSVEARQRGERRAQRYRKILNRTKAA